MKKYGSLLIFVIISLSGCTQTKDFSIYNPDNHYAVGNNTSLKIPGDIKLRRSQTDDYHLPQSKGLPKPIPSIIPPDSEALRVYLEDDDRLDMPYYERFPVYPMPK